MPNKFTPKQTPKHQVKIRVQRARLWPTPEGRYGWLPLPAVFRCRAQVGVRCQAERQSVGKSALVETPYLNVKASEITLLIADTWTLTPETMNRFDLWQSRSSLTWPRGPGFRFWIKRALIPNVQNQRLYIIFGGACLSQWFQVLILHRYRNLSAWTRTA